MHRVGDAKQVANPTNKKLVKPKQKPVPADT